MKIDQRQIDRDPLQRNQHTPRREVPSIIDLADSCSPQEHEYTSGWRDRMGGNRRKGAGAHDHAYALGWNEADNNCRSARAKETGIFR